MKFSLTATTSSSFFVDGVSCAVEVVGAALPPLLLPELVGLLPLEHPNSKATEKRKTDAARK
jgi:hypothetical protein